MSFTENLLWFLIIKQCGTVGKKKFLPNRVLTNYKEKKMQEHAWMHTPMNLAG